MPIDWRRVIVGVMCIVAGMILVEVLKQMLLVEEMGPKLWPNSPISGGNRYNFALLSNWSNLIQIVANFSPEFHILIPVFLILVFILTIYLAIVDPVRFLALSLVEFGLLVTLMSFAWLYETRIYYILIPFIVNAVLFLSRPAVTASNVQTTAAGI